MGRAAANTRLWLSTKEGLQGRAKRPTRGRDLCLQQNSPVKFRGGERSIAQIGRRNLTELPPWRGDYTYHLGAESGRRDVGSTPFLKSEHHGRSITDTKGQETYSFGTRGSLR